MDVWLLNMHKNLWDFGYLERRASWTDPRSAGTAFLLKESYYSNAPLQNVFFLLPHFQFDHFQIKASIPNKQVIPVHGCHTLAQGEGLMIIIFLPKIIKMIIYWITIKILPHCLWLNVVLIGLVGIFSIFFKWIQTKLDSYKFEVNQLPISFLLFHQFFALFFY